MKVLYLPLNSGDIIQTGMEDAFIRYGCDLKVFDFYKMKFVSKLNNNIINNKLYTTACEFKPDLIHMQLQITNIIQPETLFKIKKSIKTTITNWTGDVRNIPIKRMINYSVAVDLTLISSVGQLPMYQKEIGKNVKYWQVGYNPKLYYPKKLNKFEYDTVFIGTNYNGSSLNFPSSNDRVDTAKLLRNRIKDKFLLIGENWDGGVKSISQVIVNDIYAKCKSVISINNYNNLSHYFSDRLLMCMASGRPTICYKYPGWEDYFTDNYNILMASSPEEVLERVYWVSDNLEKANKIGENGADLVLREHSYFCRVKELMAMV